MNGIWSKLGNAAEKRVVCQQWLRMLQGSVDRVQWEAWDHDGFDSLGVDLWVEEEGKCIAIQCKTRSTGAWRPADLGTVGSDTKSVADYIRAQLIERSDPVIGETILSRFRSSEPIYRTRSSIRIFSIFPDF